MPREYRQHRFTVPPTATDILLIRHGESAAAIEGRRFDLLDGQGDPPLAADGERQARQVAARLAREGVDAVWVSSLRRTAQTAEPLAIALDIVPVVEPDLREVHLGEWEGGIFRQKVAHGDPVAFRIWQEQRWEVIPGAEASDVFTKRVRAAVERVASANVGRRVAVFTHGGVIGEIVALATGARPLAFSGSDNGSISQVVVDGPVWHVRRFNDTAHLHEPETVTGGPT